MATYDFSNAIPYVPTHVGELINDELVASGISYGDSCFIASEHPNSIQQFSAEKMNILRRKLSFFKLSHITLPKQICYIIHQQHPKQEHCHTASYLQSFQYLVLLQPLAMFDDDND